MIRCSSHRAPPSAGIIRAETQQRAAIEAFAKRAGYQRAGDPRSVGRAPAADLLPVTGELADAGFVTSQGRPFAAAAVAKVLKQRA